jgi:nicotinamide mononucleotide adenylyltransferase
MKLSVVIGRFQIDELHEGHLALLAHAAQQEGRMLVLVGRSMAGQPTTKYPLQFEAVANMIEESFEEA